MARARQRDDPEYLAESVLAGERDYPWRVYKGKRPSRTALTRWRALGDALARAKGYDRACTSCRRPLQGGFHVLVFVRNSSTTPGERHFCSGCFELIMALLDQLEASPPWSEDEPEEF